MSTQLKFSGAGAFSIAGGRLALLALAAFAFAGCTPTVNLAAKEPIVINLNIQHEVRVKIDREVDALLDQEKAAEQVGSRGLESDVSESMIDARQVAIARQGGSVGERADGYLGVVPGQESDEVGRLVERVNASRRAEYEKLASESGGPIEAVEAIAGASRVAEAAQGEHAMTVDGRWSKK